MTVSSGATATVHAGKERNVAARGLRVGVREQKCLAVGSAREVAEDNWIRQIACEPPCWKAVASVCNKNKRTKDGL